MVHLVIMLQNLLSEVAKTSGIAVHTRGDCALLSALILEETDEFISYNTLRRLHGLAASRNPRQQTLNILAKFCGYGGYQEFCGVQPKLSLWKQKEELYQILAKRAPQEAVTFFAQIENDLVRLELILCAFRESFLSNQDDFIIALLDARAYELNRYPYTYQIHTAIAMGLVIRDYPIGDRVKLLSHPNVVESIYLRLIDYSALNGYYGEWTQMLAAQPISLECTIFIACLERFKSFLNQTEILPWEWSELPWNELPPALRGRIFTVRFFEHQTQDFDFFWLKMFGSLDKVDLELSAFIEPSTFAVVTGHRQLAAWLIEKIQINESTLHEFQQHDLHVHFMMQAMHAVFDKNVKAARFWMSRFDETELRRPCFYDFLLFPVRRLQAELNGTAHIYPPEVQQTVLSLGHSRFSEDLWRTFFD